MKKDLLSLAFVLAISSSAVNASSSDEIISTTSIENIEIFEEFGCASDCVSFAKSETFMVANAFGEHPNDDLEFYLDFYNDLYADCYYGNCN